MATLNVPIRIKRGDGPPTQLRQGEMAFDQQNVKLYIGSGAEVGGYAPNVVELTTPATVLEDLSNISVGSGASDGDVLVYDSANDEWVAQALAAASVAWGDITGKPTEFDPVAHKTSHATGGTDALSPSDIGAAAAAHSHAWGDITSGVPSEFTPASHTHGNISNDGKIGSTAGLVVQTGASGALSTLTAGTAGQVLKQGSSGLEWGTAGGVGTVTSITAGTGLSGGEITSSGTIAVTVSATDKILGRATAGAGDVEEITCTAAGRALLDDADAAAQRTTLGLGGAAEKAVDFYATASHTHDASDINSGTLDIARIPTGSTSSTVCIGDDARLTNNRDPNSHTHGNITNAGAIGSTSGLPVKTGTSGVLEAGAFGTSAGEFAEGNHTHAWTDITSKPSDFTPSAHNHTVTLEISGFIEVPEGKTYVLSPSIPAAITITNVKAKTGSGTCDIKLQDDGSDIANTTINDVGTSVAEPATEPSATVAAGSVLTLVVSDLSSGAPEDLAFSVHYTVASQNNA